VQFESSLGSPRFEDVHVAQAPIHPPPAVQPTSFPLDFFPPRDYNWFMQFESLLRPPSLPPPSLPRDFIPPVPASPAFFPGVHTVRLDDVLPRCQYDAVELPTAGSAGHYRGDCKPCAFFWTKGCDSGIQCVFCHLCQPEERKRRKVDKRELRRQAKVNRVTCRAAWQ